MIAGAGFQPSTVSPGFPSRKAIKKAADPSGTTSAIRRMADLCERVLHLFLPLGETGFLKFFKHKTI